MPKGGKRIGAGGLLPSGSARLAADGVCSGLDRQHWPWDTAERPYPSDRSVSQLVAAQAGMHPSSAAVADGERILTYAELNVRANQLANVLQRGGVRKNELVAVCVERSVDMVVALLGALKAGAAYLPLDPSHPYERLAFMLADSGASVLVTQKHVAERFPFQESSVVCLDVGASALASESTSDTGSDVSANDLAYVIYTSGSTGCPKGVQILHGSLLNLVFWHQRAFAITDRARASQIASPSFDALGWELWPYLVAGASIHLVGDDIRALPEAIRDWLIGRGITHTFLPTALAEHVLALDWPPRTALRYLLTGGDVLHHHPSRGLPFAVINNYGPTEATVVATSGLVPPVPGATSPPSIGRAIDNTQVYILNQQLQQAALGETGEIYIGGAGLAAGYRNRPDLTAASFIVHPYSTKRGERLYKTGDLARFLPNGEIAFVGRADHQIELRGFRIEPNEITAALNSHPDVLASVVMAREEQPGEKRLVAYVVAAPSASLTANALRATIARHVPEYMVPTTYVQLAGLPVTPNGKVDRAALPVPDAENVLRDEIVRASTPTEKCLLRILGELLERDGAEISVEDNFFLLGGHSFLGTQLIVRVAQTFGVDVSLRKLFIAPSVRELAAEVERLLEAKVATLSDEDALRILGRR